MPQFPVSGLSGGASMYGSREEAVLAAMKAARNGRKNVEVGGGLIFNPVTQQYAFTDPAGMSNDAHFGARVQFPKPWTLVGIFHSHPAGPQSTRFSADDLEMADKLKVPSYILSRYDDKVRMFDPAKTARSKSVEGAFSLGDLVDETPKQQAASSGQPVQPTS